MVVRCFINTFFSSNTYVLFFKRGRSAWVIDPGDAEPIIRYLRENNKTLEGILITHCHYDHIYGINDLQVIFPNAKIYASANARDGLFSPQHNMSKYNESPYSVIKQDVVCVAEGSIITFGDNLSVKVQETPGHHPSCLTFEVGNELFTGDSLIPGVKVVTILPGGNKLAAKQSIKRIFDLYGKKTLIWPGHGEGCLLEDITMESCFVN